MGIDIQLLQAEKGGDLQSVIDSQKKRFASEELVIDTLALYKEWTKREWRLFIFYVQHLCCQEERSRWQTAERVIKDATCTRPAEHAGWEV